MQGPLRLTPIGRILSSTNDRQHMVKNDWPKSGVGSNVGLVGRIFGQLPPHFKHKFSFVHLGEYQKCTNDCYL